MSGNKNPGKPGFFYGKPRAIRLFCCGSGFDDHGESVGFQRGAAHQRAVDIRLGEQLCGVLVVHRTAVLDDDFSGNRGIVFGDVIADKFVHGLCLCRVADLPVPMAQTGS